MTQVNRPDIDLRRSESKAAALMLWGSMGIQCELDCCLGLWHRDDYHDTVKPSECQPLRNKWDELSGPSTIERGDLVKVKGIPLKDARHGGGSTCGIVVAVRQTMIDVACIGFDDPREPLPIGSTWLFSASFGAERLEIVKKRVK